MAGNQKNKKPRRATQQQKNQQPANPQKPKNNAPPATKSVEKGPPLEAGAVNVQNPPPEVRSSNVQSLPPEIRKRSFSFDRFFFMFISVVCMFCAIVGYVMPMVVWIWRLMNGTNDSALGTYLTNASAAVGFVSVCLGLVSIYKSWQSDKQAAETANLLRDVRQKLNYLEWQLTKANTALDRMYTATRSESAPPPAQGFWQQDKSRDVESR